MGCDIHTAVQVRKNGIWEDVDLRVFDGRHYGLFAFLANVRNYSAITPLDDPRGVPDDFDSEAYREWGCDAHSASWFSGAELGAIDFNQVIEDRRVTRQTAPNCFDGSCTCSPGNGNQMRLYEFLGAKYVNDIQAIAAIGDSRLVFWFDN